MARLTLQATGPDSAGGSNVLRRDRRVGAPSSGAMGLTEHRGQETAPTDGSVIQADRTRNGPIIQASPARRSAAPRRDGPDRASRSGDRSYDGSVIQADRTRNGSVIQADRARNGPVIQAGRACPDFSIVLSRIERL